MGLDNSIEVRRNAYTSTIPELRRFEEVWDTKHQFDFEVAYFRKCWNVRTVIFGKLGRTYNNEESDQLTIEDIENIIDGLKSFNSRNWQEYGGSIWEWSDYKDHMKNSIKNLKYLVKLMKKYDLEVYFSDSY